MAYTNPSPVGLSVFICHDSKWGRLMTHNYRNIRLHEVAQCKEAIKYIWYLGKAIVKLVKNVQHSFYNR